MLLDSKPSVGQAPLEPVQCSATSQTPAEGRQTVLLGSKPSLGQVTAVPSQCSATSQSPPVGRHTVVAGATSSLGQGCPAAPVQFSATSQGPAAGRHVTKAPLTLSAGQGWPATPVQVSSGSQRSPEPVRQTVPLAVTTSAGQVGVVPSQCSAGSHESPDPGRHTAPACPAGWAHVPVPLHWSVVQVSPSSVHAVPPGSKQLFAPSLHVLAHSGPPVQGSPACTAHEPPLQVSAPSQKRPSLQAEPLGSGAVQLLAASLQDSLQLPSPLGPGHGSPVCAEQLPPLQVSLPLQKRPSVQAEPLGSGAVQLSAASLQDSLQLPSPSGPGHGSPVCAEQVPPLQVSAPSQKRPSLQAEPLGSGAVQLSAASLHDSLQLPSPSGPGQGSPACTVQVPPLQVSAPLQNRPSLQGAVLFGCVQRLLVPLQTSLVQTLPSSVQPVPAVLNVQSVAQHEPAVPLFAPSSQASPIDASMVPSPQYELSLTSTKWPSLPMVRPPGPGYVPAVWPLSVQAIPRRTATSSAPAIWLPPGLLASKPLAGLE